MVRGSCLHVPQRGLGSHSIGWIDEHPNMNGLGHQVVHCGNRNVCFGLGTDMSMSSATDRQHSHWRFRVSNFTQTSFPLICK
jgi:hypothetical protein